MFKIAAKDNPYALECLPDQYKTNEMCHKAVEKIPGS